jgi:hypothetical protein
MTAVKFRDDGFEKITVMAGLVLAIHAFGPGRKSWMPGPRPGMTAL